MRKSDRAEKSLEVMEQHSSLRSCLGIAEILLNRTILAIVGMTRGHERRKKECVCECLEREGERERQKKMNSTNVRQTSTQLPLIWLNQTFAYKGNLN